MTDGAALASAAGAGMATCAFIWMARSGKYPTFGRWWNAEGVVIAIILAVLLFAVFGSRYL